MAEEMPASEAIAAELLRLARTHDEDGDERTARLLLDARWMIRAEQPEVPNDVKIAALRYDARRDQGRFIVATLLIAALALVIALGLLHGADGDAVSQFASPISGLAGIAVGWIFGGRRE